MKKLVALLLAVAFAFAFCGCGDEPEKAATEAKPDVQNQTVACGDYTFEIASDYEAITDEEFGEQYLDMSAFENETRTVTINYFDNVSYKDAAGIAELMSSNFDPVETATVEEDCGTCYYVVGDFEGFHQALAFFDSGEKTYMVDMTSANDVLTQDDVAEIIKSVK